MDESREAATPAGEEETQTAPSKSAPRFPLSPSETRLSRLYYGPDGLRPIWRLLIFILLWRAFYFLLPVVLYLVARNLGPIRYYFLAEAGLVLTVVIPTLIMAALEHRPFGFYGLPCRGAFGKLFWAGVLWGLGSLTVLMVAMHFAGLFDLGSLNLHGFRVFKFAVFWAIFFLLVGFYEEILVRGYAQSTLTASVGFWPAAILLSAAFGALHIDNPGEAPSGIAGVVVIGLFFCLTLKRTGNLWFAIGFHAAWDWGESFLYSVPDSGLTMPGHLVNSTLRGPAWLSGGSVGPEGSIFAFAVIGLTWLAFHFVYRETSYVAWSGGDAPATSPETTPRGLHDHLP